MNTRLALLLATLSALSAFSGSALATTPIEDIEDCTTTTTATPTWTPPPPQPTPQAPTNNSCNVVNQKCCNQMQDYDDTTKSLIGLFGLNAQGFNGQIGLSCSSLASGSQCTANPVCCTGDSANGLFALGCSPINAPLLGLPFMG